MQVKEWAQREGLTAQTVYRWCQAGLMPERVEVIHAGKNSILLYDPKYEPEMKPQGPGKTVCYARVSSSDQKGDLVRQADRIKAFAHSMNLENVEVITEIASGMNDSRKRLNQILQDSEATTIIVEHRDRLSRLSFTLISSALQAQGRRIIVVDGNEVEDDLVRDMTEVLTSFCARLYGKRSAKNRALKALKAAEHE
ncbi:IS607 family transposase [Alloscardovia criceti]|uniref:IS607 family transposase n=1 Tax=Alloscardovia criceti TaxID=356828 RepID=UPI00036F1866|nr:IS607 family transposase [Alloscardovia criceti]